MRIDAFTHFYPARYYRRMEEVGAGLKDMFRRARAVQAIHDLDARLRVIAQFADYAQILSLPMPTLETVSKGDAKIALELAQIGNDGLAELVAKHPRQFPAFVAQAPLTAGDAGAAEVVGDDLQALVFVERLGEDQSRHCGAGLVGPAECPPDLVQRLPLVEVVGMLRPACRV